MLIAPIAPVTKADHSTCLRHHDVLPFLHDTVFDEFVGLTARIFSLPISLFNLVDAHQVTTKAHYGLPGATPQPRAEMLCSIVVEQNRVIVYHDLTTTIPTPTDAVAIQATLAKRIRFYAAAPVRLTNECSIGALCLLDQRPREFTLEEQHVLQSLADLVSQGIAVRHRCRTTPELGEAHWQQLHTQMQDEVHSLGALVRYLLTRYGTITPVPEEVLHLVSRRLADLHIVLQQ
jgi:GAF domain-containing protein